jgi:hypothetical protein
VSFHATALDSHRLRHIPPPLLCPGSTPFPQVLELLLSQERVISLLYDRALPPRMSFGGFGGIADIVTAGAQPLALVCLPPRLFCVS